MVAELKHPVLFFNAFLLLVLWIARVPVKIIKYRLNGKHLVGWMCQTGVAVGMDLEDKMPYNEYYEYFGPDYTLHVTPSNMENQNSRAYLDTIRSS